MSESKCQINGNKIEPCAALAQSLEHDAEYTTRKGLLKYKIYNHELIHSQDLIMLRSGEFSKSPNGDAEKRMTGADWLTAIEMYKPTVRIVEVNVPRAAGIRTKGDAGEQSDEKP